MSDDSVKGASKSRGRKMLRRAVRLESFAAMVGLATQIKDYHAGLSPARKPFEWQPGAGRSVLLKDVDVVDVKRGQVNHHRGILFADGRITDIVGTRGLGNVSADAVFDCNGLVAIPGLINCHCHILMPGGLGIALDLAVSLRRQSLRNFEECAVRGVTTVREASSLPLVLNTLTSKIDNFELLGPRVVGCASGIKAVGGYPDFTARLPRFLEEKLGQFSYDVTDPESGRAAVRLCEELGARFIKLFFDDQSLFFGHKRLNVLDDATVRAIVKEAHDTGRRVGVHQSQLKGFRRALELGVDDLEHMPVDGYLTDDDVAKFMDGDHHITPTITVGLSLGIAREGHPALADPLMEALAAERERVQRVVSPSAAEPAIVKMNQKVIDILTSLPEGGKPRVPFISDPEPFLTGIGEANIRKMYEAGAKFCCGNDGGVPLTWPGTLAIEMGLLEYLGVSRADVLRSATINAASLIDMESELGSIEAGKLADIVLLSENPFDDIRAVERVEAVFRSGVLLHRGPRFGLVSKG